MQQEVKKDEFWGRYGGLKYSAMAETLRRRNTESCRRWQEEKKNEVVSTTHYLYRILEGKCQNMGYSIDLLGFGLLNLKLFKKEMATLFLGRRNHLFNFEKW